MLPSPPPPGQLQLLRPLSQPATPRPSRFAVDTFVNPGVKVEGEVVKQAPGPFHLLPLLQHHSAKASRAQLPYPSSLLLQLLQPVRKRKSLSRSSSQPLPAILSRQHPQLHLQPTPLLPQGGQKEVIKESRGRGMHKAEINWGVCTGPR